MSTAIGCHSAGVAGASPRTVVDVSRLTQALSDAQQSHRAALRSISIWSMRTMALLMMMPERLMSRACRRKTAVPLRKDETYRPRTLTSLPPPNTGRRRVGQPGRFGTNSESSVAAYSIKPPVPRVC